MHATFEIGLARRKRKLERDCKHQQMYSYLFKPALKNSML
jgi:hypothetical protein